jgi:hypothetical protein
MENLTVSLLTLAMLIVFGVDANQKRRKYLQGKKK